MEFQQSPSLAVGNSPRLSPLCPTFITFRDYKTPPSGMLELWERAEAEWDKMPAEVCQNLIGSMPRRIVGVLKPHAAILSTDNIQFSAVDSSATKLFECDLGHKIIVSWEATNRFLRFFVFHIGEMIGHIGGYLYNFAHFISPSIRCAIQNFQTWEQFHCSL